MKHKGLALCILTALGLSALATDGQQKGRVSPMPTSYIKAGKFLELTEVERVAYTMGLLDGFYGSALFDATDEAVDRLNSCTKEMDSKQMTAVISKFVTDHPEKWHLPLSMGAYDAINSVCPRLSGH
jgi:hypothetical protein